MSPLFRDLFAVVLVLEDAERLLHGLQVVRAEVPQEGRQQDPHALEDHVW